VPPPLIEQLKLGGRLVMPLGPAEGLQQLVVVEKVAPGQTTRRSIIPVRFVPFTRAPQ
jgi:protein-L-isoaspartate(D-aspartate) O-methyltransferase